MDYVSKWAEAIATPVKDSKVVQIFLKKQIFTKFGVPRVLISNGSSHFCNQHWDRLLQKYGVRHRITIPYHPQANGQT